MNHPPIDRRKSEEIIEEIKKLIPYYFPQWSPEEGEPGWAIVQIFSEMYEDVLEGLNKVPENLFLDFIERLGFKLIPPKPSRAPVVFEPVKENTVEVKKGTKLSSKSGLIFETEETLTVTPSKIVKIYSVNPFTDSIKEHANEIPSYLFEGEKQKHYLYIGDDHLFMFKKAIGKNQYLYLIPPFDAKWQYFAGYDENGNEIWKSFRPIRKYYLRKSSEFSYWVSSEFSRFSVVEEGRIYYKKDPEPSLKKEINGIETFWLRAELTEEHRYITTENTCSIYGSSGVDSLFYNDVPISADSLLSGKTIFPFGKEPKVGDSFYIASDETFSKRSGFIRISFRFNTESYFSEYIEANGERKETQVSWEYWNGKSWKSLNVSISKNSDLKEETITFICPSDMSQTEVNGEKHYWIRVRITGISYGSYRVLKDRVEPVFYAPEIVDININFSVKDVYPEHSFSFNNLDFEKIGKKIIKPFKPVKDRFPSVYIGFNSKFDSINVFFSLKSKNWDERKILKWSFWNGNTWEELNVKDGTDKLGRSGIFKLIVPSEIKPLKRFGKELYWLRLELEKEWKTEKIEKKTGKEKTDGCPRQVNVFNNLLSFGKGERIEISGIYTNVVYAVQWETIKDEIVGSSDSSPNQRFRLKKKPVIDAQIWVKEAVKPSEKGTKYKEDEGSYWVLWQEVDDLKFSCEKCRHYSIDKVSGELKFGDGKRGRIPPKGKDNIRATYKVGGGAKGNVPPHSITSLVTSIAYIDKVYNIEEATGGSNQETKEKILNRVPKTIRNRERAINLFDLETLTESLSTEIEKLKVIPNLNRDGLYETGWITVVVLHKSGKSGSFLKELESILKKNIPVTAKLQVIPPIFGEVDVSLRAVIKDYSKYLEIKNTIKEKLERFLDPMNGNIDGSGWEFGEVPCYSDFFVVLNTIDEIKFIKNLFVKLRAGNKEISISSDRTFDIKVPEYLLITPGVFNIEIEGA